MALAGPLRVNYKHRDHSPVREYVHTAFLAQALIQAAGSAELRTRLRAPIRARVR
jgi:hypothetical protein